MTTDKKEFGNFLREMITNTGMSQAKFYAEVEITKPYFYDILSGKVNPPPPEVQYKMIETLNLQEPKRSEFLNLAAKGRDEVPADIASLIKNNPDKLADVRLALAQIMVQGEEK